MTSGNRNANINGCLCTACAIANLRTTPRQNEHQHNLLPHDDASYIVEYEDHSPPRGPLRVANPDPDPESDTDSISDSWSVLTLCEAFPDHTSSDEDFHAEADEEADVNLAEGVDRSEPTTTGNDELDPDIDLEYYQELIRLFEEAESLMNAGEV